MTESLRKLNLTRALADRLTRPYAMRRADLHAMFLSAFQATPAELFDDDELAPTEPEDIELINGVAIIPILGVMMKQPPAWYVRLGYATDTDNVREQVLAASTDNAVRAILLTIHSPGGEVYGLDQLSDAVFAARSAKPVHAYIEDLGASAAYEIASQANVVTANRTAMVGSIGTYIMIEDVNRCLMDMGIDTRVISSALLKGGDAGGSLITEAEIADAQRIVDDFTAEFEAALRRGRALTQEEIAAVATGQVWLGPEAIRLKLIDGLGTADNALARAAASSMPAPPPGQAETPLEGVTAMKLFTRRSKAPAESAKASSAANDAKSQETEAAPEETPAETGALTVTLTPPEAVEAGAMFKVDDGEPQASATTVEGLAPGEHGVSYTSAEGYVAPPDETVAITAGETTVLEREYAAAETEPEAPPEPAPDAKLTADQVAELSASIGAEKAIAAYRSGRTAAQALTDEVVTLRARIAAQETALAASEALGSNAAVPVTPADATAGGTGTGRDQIGEAAAGMKYAKK